MMTARQHLDQTIEEALEQFDKNGPNAGVATFLRGVGEHRETVHIGKHPHTHYFLTQKAEQSRDAFALYMRSFAG